MQKRILLLIAFIVLGLGFLQARSIDGHSSKKLDLLHSNDIGNIWLRVSNYGFFGSGSDANPQWPSLEYPGGSGIDYLFQGALWFGAKKIRRDSQNRTLYWKNWPPTSENDVIAENYNANWMDSLHTASPMRVLDTLVTVGFDGYNDILEFLPAYNPLESTTLGTQYTSNNIYDQVAIASIREQRRGVDDDGDGKIDEDPVGFGFKLRPSSELPLAFQSLGGQYIADTGSNLTNLLSKEEYASLWFPLGFMDLSYIDPTRQYLFCVPNDDDGDGLEDEDGFPVSEQDLISYYYDYSPFGTAGDRDWGDARTSSDHYPLNVRVRQMSYQWSFGYIKNLVYVEFDITNMNQADTLFDCAMGIYMDSDVGPQVWESTKRSSDDNSGYISGTGYEFAYTYDVDHDGGLTPGYVGARVCSPDPEQLEFACWTWDLEHAGPNDKNPRKPWGLNGNATANEKYWLLTNRNPDDDKFSDLKDPNYQPSDPNGVDTRYLFAFFGDCQGVETPADTLAWNLLPGRTMKIVIALFPGMTIEELKGQAEWAKTIYGKAQNLSEVVEPDVVSHYNPPEPPPNPKSYLTYNDDGTQINVFWDNRSEFMVDTMTISSGDTGWRDDGYTTLDADISHYDAATFPADYEPNNNPNSLGYNYNAQALVNPWTSYRLRHDFQGYQLWGRSGSGSSEDWQLKQRWDKKETAQDLADYEVARNVVSANGPVDKDYGGYLGADRGLPNAIRAIDNADAFNQWHFDEYYQYNDLYSFTKISDLRQTTPNLEVYGVPLYDYRVDYTDSLASVARNLSFTDQALLFKNPGITKEQFLALYDDALIPLQGHNGQAALNQAPDAVTASLLKMKKERLARRMYNSSIMYPPPGIEYYVSVNAYDRGIPSQNLLYLESGKDENMKTIFPGCKSDAKMRNIHVVPNPYLGLSKFDGRVEDDEKGDKSRRIWFVGLPEKCTVRIYTLGGDLVDKFEHNGYQEQPLISVSTDGETGVQASGIHPWDLLSKNNQIIASGIYLFSVEDKKSGDIKVGKFVVIK